MSLVKVRGYWAAANIGAGPAMRESHAAKRRLASPENTGQPELNAVKSGAVFGKAHAVPGFALARPGLHQVTQISSIRSSRPTILAARCRLSMVALPL